jgi:hypothetical protein
MQQDSQISGAEMKTINIIIESAKDSIWGRWENGKDIVVSSGANLEELKVNLVEAINLYLEETDKSPLDVGYDNFEFQVDLESLFEINDFINISKLAEHAGLNKSLLRQYARGLKYPSIKQALKIERALQDIGSNLVNTKIIAGQAMHER